MRKFKPTKENTPSLPPKAPFWNSKKTILILALGIIILMIGSVLTLFSEEQQPTQDYNSYSFFQTDGGWIATLNGQQASFEHHPTEPEPIPAEPFTLPVGKIYLLFNPEETSQDAYELQRLKAFLFATGRTPVPACITQQNCPDIPLKTCTDSDTMIYLHYSNESAITKQDNCILLQAEDTDPARVVNRFIYTIYGVMQ